MTNVRLLDGQVALVAGAGPGIGREVARTLATHGARVGLLARRQQMLDSIASEIIDDGGEAAGVSCDITDPDACARAVAQVEQELGPIDGLVSNASKVNDGTFILGAEPRFENWRGYFDVILYGSLTISRAVLPGMQARRRGSIVMVNSMVTDLDPAGYGAYPAAKSALESATRQLAREVGPDNVRVNGVYPGITDGETVQNVLVPKLVAESGRGPDEVMADLERQHALRFLANGTDLGHAIAFLMSDLSRAVTGQALHVNAGGHFH